MPKADRQSRRPVDAGSEILQLSLEKFHWKTTGQIDRVNDLFDDDLEFTHITGRVTSKREWIDELRSKRFIYNSIEDKGASVEVAGHRATLIGRAIFNVTMGGFRGRFDIDFTEVYERKGDRWTLLVLRTRSHQ